MAPFFPGTFLLNVVKDVADQREWRNTFFSLNSAQYSGCLLGGATKLSICSPSYLVGHGRELRWDLWQPCWPLFLSLSLHVSHFNAELIQSGSGWCRNNHRAQHSFSKPGRKWPWQLLAIQPETLFGWPTLWHYLFSTVTPTALFVFLLGFLFCLTSSAGKYLNTLTQ